MSAEWTTERVLALAPDPASSKAGQGLASAKKWANLGRTDGLIWGECQGSGKDPYRTLAAPDEPAFSCSCPSRKFPCKHALGLMLVWASGPAAIAEGTPTAWVDSWKQNREKKAEAKKEKADRPPAPVGAAAQAKRRAARVAKVAAGLDDLSLWLCDLVRQGFTSLGTRSGSVWDDQARRMIDAQAPGVARRLRQIDEMSLSGEGWQASLLDRLARLHLLTEGFRRRESLPPEVAYDVRSAIGFPIDLDAIRSGPSVRDYWQVIGHAFAQEDRIVVRRTWLLGREMKRPALLLDFAAGGKPLDAGLPPGFSVEADLAMVPGAFPLRAIEKERHAPLVSMDAIEGGMTITEAFTAYGSALAKLPWLELYPVVLNDVLLQREGDPWSARDTSGAILPLSSRFRSGWHLMALGGGGPLQLCGEFDGEKLEVLGCRVHGRYHSLVTPDMRAQEKAAVSMPVVVPLLVEATASAVVGVDRKAPPSPHSGDPIAEALAGLETLEAPPRLLAIAAAASLYGRVGRKPMIDSAAAPEACPPETQPECRAEAALRLRLMLGGEQTDLLPEWLGLLAASGRSLPHDSLTPILERQAQMSLPVESFIAALGVRGRWLATKNPAWNKFAGLEATSDPAAVWETGTRHERLAALRSLRDSDPSRARELVESTFASEPADIRTEFLGEFRRNLTMADEPFLEATLDDRGREVRRQAAALLGRLPDSRLSLRMIARARGILSWKKGLLGLGRGTLVVAPPSECDKGMVRDGVRPKAPPGTKLGDRAIWLRDVIAATPPAAIAAMLGLTAAEIVEASRGNDWGEAILDGWTDATIRHEAADWAHALLERDPPGSKSSRHPTFDRNLFESLTIDQRNSLFLRLLRSTPGPHLTSRHPASAFLRSLGTPVDPRVAREILDRVRRLLADEQKEFSTPERRSALQNDSGSGFDPKYHDYGSYEMILGLADVLPFELAEHAALGFAPEGPPTPRYADAYAKMIDRLTFRRDMHLEFAL